MIFIQEFESKSNETSDWTITRVIKHIGGTLHAGQDQNDKRRQFKSPLAPVADIAKSIKSADGGIEVKETKQTIKIWGPFEAWNAMFPAKEIDSSRIKRKNGVYIQKKQVLGFQKERFVNRRKTVFYAENPWLFYNKRTYNLIIHWKVNSKRV